MKHLITISFFFSYAISFAQSDSIIKQFDSRKNNLNHNGMIVLSSWAGANIIGSAIGYGLTNSNEEKEFYLMNGSWGIINLGIALPGLLTKQNQPPQFMTYKKIKQRLKNYF